MLCWEFQNIIIPCLAAQQTLYLKARHYLNCALVVTTAILLHEDKDKIFHQSKRHELLYLVCLNNSATIVEAGGKEQTGCRTNRHSRLQSDVQILSSVVTR